MRCRCCPRNCCQKMMKNTMTHFQTTRTKKKMNRCLMRMMSYYWNLTTHLTRVPMITMILFLWRYSCLAALLILSLSMTLFCFWTISTFTSTLISCLLIRSCFISFSLLSLHFSLYFYRVSSLHPIFVCVTSFLLGLASFIFIYFLSLTWAFMFLDPFMFIFSWEVLVLISFNV